MTQLRKTLPLGLLLAFALTSSAFAARLEVLPGEVTVQPNDRIRLTAIAWVGPKDEPVATLPPAVEWRASAGQIDQHGLLMIPASAPPMIEVRARVGSLEATARLKVRRVDLVILPEQVRVVVGKKLRFTALDYSKGHARTPAKIEWEAERGLVTASGRYHAPDSAGPDTITIKIGDRVAKAQVMIVSTVGKSEPEAGKPTPKPSPKPSPQPKDDPEPEIPAKPWTVSWRAGSGFGTKEHKIRITIHDPRAVRLKAFIRKLGSGSESTATSRVVKAGQKHTITLQLGPTASGARVVLYDKDGKILARRSRSK